jgi:hypothetical protein
MRLLAVALATFRIASLLSAEAGPFDIFGRLRARFPDHAHVILTGAGYREVLPQDSPEEVVVIDIDSPGAELGKALRCQYCSSIWIAPFLGWLDRHGSSTVVDAFAAAGAVTLWLDLQHLLINTLDPAIVAGPGGDPADAAD